MKLVIFDCDGTIVDSQNSIVTAMDYAFGAADLSAPSRRAVTDIIGLSLVEVFEVLAPDATQEQRNLLAGHYRDAFSHMQGQIAHQEPLFDGARAAIEALSARDDVILGIATGKSMRGVERLFSRETLGAHFATVQTADRHPSKPHPAMIEQAMSDVGADPDQTVMIGDTSYDMEMAVNAGVAALGVDWGYHPAAWLKDAGAQAIALGYGDLIGHIDALFDKGRGQP